MKFLFLETFNGSNGCELYYASCVAKKIAQMVKELGHEVIEVDRPSPADANNAIKTHRPDIVWWVGHGNADSTTLEKVQYWITTTKNQSILDGTIADALSCITARNLGKLLTKSYGCKYYLGYYSEFWFVWCQCPNTTGCACGEHTPSGVRKKVAEYAFSCMHEANLYFILGLAKGFTPEQAHWYSLERFEQWIKFWKSFEPQNNKENSLIASVLQVLKIDKPIQRLCHNGEYVDPEPAPESPPPIPPIGKAVLHVTSNPAGAKVYVDGSYKGDTPLDVYVEPGTHTVKVELEGYVPQERTITCEEGKTYEVSFNLTKPTVVPLQMMSLPLGLAAIGYGLYKLKEVLGER